MALAAAETAYAAGPARQADNAATNATTRPQCPWFLVSKVLIRTTATAVRAATVHASHGCQSGVRRSRANDHAPVAATVAVNTQPHTPASRRVASTSRTAPMPVSAPTAGARAVV